jgi:hypothetical protein
LKRSGYAGKKSAKGTLCSPFSGLPGFFHSCPVSTGSDENQDSTFHTVSKTIGL